MNRKIGSPIKYKVRNIIEGILNLEKVGYRFEGNSTNVSVNPVKKPPK